MKYRAEIDGLRALAVVPVILFHAGFELFRGGFVGVDVFFVISGYLITTILIEDIENERFSIVNFYERRARRILPALFLVMLVCIPFAWMWMLPTQMKDFSQSLVAVSLFASNILFWRESGYFNAAAEEKPLLHTWSLAVEEQYYVLFPIFLILAWRFGKNRVFWMIVVMAAISLLLSEWGWRNEATANFYLAPTRAWELFAGSIAAFIVQKKGVQKNNALSLLGLAAIVFSIFFYDETIPFPSVYALVPVLGVVLLVLYADKETFAAKLLSTRAFVGVGLISYSAYLWHQPLFAFARLRTLENPSLLLMSALCVLSLSLAYYSWLFIEKPFRNRQLIEGKKSLIISLFGLISFFGVGIIGHLSGGFDNRFPKNLQTLQTDFTGRKPELCDFNEDYCVLGNIESEHSILVFGDSHAERLFHPIVDRYGADYKIFLTWERSCYLGDAKWQPLLGHDPLLCERKREIISDLVRNESFTYIIQSQFWINDDYDFESISNLTEALVEQINALRHFTNELVIVGNTPYNPIICLQRQYIGLQCDLYAREIEFEEAGKNIAEENRMNVNFIHPYKLHNRYLNGQIFDSKMIYADQHHLSDFGADLLAAEIAETLQ
ncbi:hypothetical protein EOPP23_15120 [Endozoicomonas sp. OPT23]|uniref:acyltransferase family protein n=1 Tax=Endozoicomonas sp. OPT23 TaxID=2072845 RepID=UPI00129A9B4E|nr:acyltransferase family protein [Endozoicomonas sp. OPT23]MRI34319.1 hypothetical protein [Endozoicomonas sp. OPT23]